MLKKLLIITLLISQTACGKVASWYGRGFEGKNTASGYLFDSRQYTCASNAHDFGTVLKVTNKENNKSVVVVVTDRGSFKKKYGRDIDLSHAAFTKIANPNEGLIKVKISVLNQKNTFKYKHGNPVFTAREYNKYVKK